MASLEVRGRGREGGRLGEARIDDKIEFFIVSQEEAETEMAD
jgi:hypothetical protein